MKPPTIEIGYDSEWPYIAINGTRVAERRPHKIKPHMAWVAVAPGWQVIGGDTGKSGEMPDEIIAPYGPVAFH